MLPQSDAFALAVSVYGKAPRATVLCGDRRWRVRCMAGAYDAVRREVSAALRGATDAEAAVRRRASAEVLQAFLRALFETPSLVRSSLQGTQWPRLLPGDTFWRHRSLADGAVCVAVPHPQHGPAQPPVAFLYGSRAWVFDSDHELAVRAALAELAGQQLQVALLPMKPARRPAWCAAVAMRRGEPPSCADVRSEFHRWAVRLRARSPWGDKSCSRGSAAMRAVPAPAARGGVLPDAGAVYGDRAVEKAAVAVVRAAGTLTVLFGVLLTSDTMRIIRQRRFKLPEGTTAADDFITSMLQTATSSLELELVAERARPPPTAGWLPVLLRMRLLCVTLVGGVSELHSRASGGIRAASFADAASLFATEYAANRCELMLLEQHRAFVGVMPTTPPISGPDTSSASMFSGAVRTYACADALTEAAAAHRVRLALEAAPSAEAALHALAGALGGEFVPAGEPEYCGTLTVCGLPHAITVGMGADGTWSARTVSLSDQRFHEGECAATAALKTITSYPVTAPSPFWAAVLASPSSAQRCRVCAAVATAPPREVPGAAEVWEAAMGEGGWARFLERPNDERCGPKAMAAALEVVNRGALIKPAQHSALQWGDAGDATVVVGGNPLGMRINWATPGKLRFEWFGSGDDRRVWSAAIFCGATAVWRCADVASPAAADSLENSMKHRVRNGCMVDVAWGSGAAAPPVNIVIATEHEPQLCIRMCSTF